MDTTLYEYTDQPMLVKILIRAGTDLERRGQYDWTALHVVADNNNHEVAKILIDVGSNLEAHSRTESTPLHLAIRHDQTDVLGLLIRAGANLNAQNMYGMTALHDASWAKREASMKLLIASGADESIRDDRNHTPADMPRIYEIFNRVASDRHSQIEAMFQEL